MYRGVNISGMNAINSQYLQLHEIAVLGRQCHHPITWSLTVLTPSQLNALSFVSFKTAFVHPFTSVTGRFKAAQISSLDHWQAHREVR